MGATDFFKEELEFNNGNLEELWSELSPYMLTNYLSKHSIPEKYYDDFIKGVELSQNKHLLNAYLKLKGAMD